MQMPDFMRPGFTSLLTLIANTHDDSAAAYNHELLSSFNAKIGLRNFKHHSGIWLLRFAVTLATFPHPLGLALPAAAPAAAAACSHKRHRMKRFIKVTKTGTSGMMNYDPRRWMCAQLSWTRCAAGDGQSVRCPTPPSKLLKTKTNKSLRWVCLL